MPIEEKKETRLGDLKGKSVIDHQGNDFGHVDDVTVDPDVWRVTGLVVSVNNEVADQLKIHRPVMGSAQIVVGSERIERMGDNVILNVGVSEMGDKLQTR